MDAAGLACLQLQRTERARTMQNILINTSQCRRRTSSVEFGVHLAAKVGAAVTGTYVYPSLLQAIPRLSSPDLVSTILANAEAAAADGRRFGGSFVEWAHSAGVDNAAWHVAEANMTNAMADIGLWHDLFVLGHDPDFPWGSASDIASLIFAAALPAVVVPAQALDRMTLDCIAFAWNGSPEATRALRAALPLLERASRVVVLVGEQRSASVIGWKPGFDLDGYLGRHGIAFESRDFSADSNVAGERLLEECSAVNADMLVMGMYGRGRFSEWILGGATRHILKHAPLPVLLCH